MLTEEAFDYEHAWWRLFQKHLVRTKLDIYVFIFNNYIINKSQKSGQYSVPISDTIVCNKNIKRAGTV